MACINALRTVVPGPVQGLNRVPPEIFHYIFERVKDDKKTLWSSSFVSRYWRELSLPWLFAEIDILSAQQFAEFLEFVDTHPHLGAHVHRVNFRPHVHPKLHPPVPEDSLRTFLSSTISKLPSLRSLSLRDIRVVTDPSPSSTLPLAPVDPERETALNRHLRHLSIECSVHGQSFWSPLLVWLLSTFAVDTLNLDGVQIPQQDDSNGTAVASVLDQARNSIQVPNLVMNLYASSHHDTYTFLEKILRSGSLQSLSLSCTSSSEMARIVRFMGIVGIVGLNVTYLSLDITFFSVSRDGLFEPDPNWTELGTALACCPRLENLRIRISAFSFSQYSLSPRCDVFTAIVPCAPRSLQTLTVELAEDQPWHRNSGDFETWDLRALAMFLTREPPAFPSLRSVGIELTLDKCVDNEQLVEILLPDLSALKDAGLLRVFCDEMTQESRMRFGIEPLPARKEW